MCLVAEHQLNVCAIKFCCLPRPDLQRKTACPMPRIYTAQVLHFHRIIEWPGLKRITMLIQFQPPAMCRVANQQTRLPRATCSLALNACSDGASTPPWATCSVRHHPFSALNSNAQDVLHVQSINVLQSIFF